MQKLEQLILPVVLLSVLAIRAGSAIECYNCDSSVNEECSAITKTSSLKPVNCKPSVTGQGVGDWLKEIIRIDFFETGEVSVPMVCQKFIAVNEESKEILFRGCQLDGGKTNVCETVTARAKKLNVDIKDCEICTKDGCNKAPSQLISIWLLIIPLALIKFFF